MTTILNFLDKFIQYFIFPVVLLIISKFYETKINRTLIELQNDIKHIKKELELDKTIDSYMSDLYKLLNYLHRKNQNIIKEHLSKNIIDTCLYILRSGFVNQKKTEEIETLFDTMKNYCALMLSKHDVVIDDVCLYLDYWEKAVIDIVLDTYNRKESRIVKETQELIKCIYLVNIKGEVDENTGKN